MGRWFRPAWLKSLAPWFLPLWCFPVLLAVASLGGAEVMVVGWFVCLWGAGAIVWGLIGVIRGEVPLGDALLGGLVPTLVIAAGTFGLLDLARRAFGG
ncbi:MAG: hypothetical protein IT577_12655 [Verrucomicrobiae bacterium]|nr:hypothetical protein [Verrucomicrobiae bacterium]